MEISSILTGVSTETLREMEREVTREMYAAKSIGEIVSLNAQKTAIETELYGPTGRIAKSK